MHVDFTLTVIRIFSSFVRFVHPCSIFEVTRAFNKHFVCSMQLVVTENSRISLESVLLQHFACWVIFRTLTCFKINFFKIFFQEHLSNYRVRSRISGKKVHMNKGGGVRFADFISFSLNIP